ncbi:diacylglycerol/lipid kinase family protein [Spirillospora sp. NPDC048911]|uniref:diacylglycerol/lipid kinase family protein n=1 Tax=Spirillospora sp. NPDC048911 TaxID=3364527 RepID=UPI00371B38BB
MEASRNTFDETRDGVAWWRRQGAAARLAVAFGSAAVLTMLLSAGLRSITLLLTGAAGLIVTAAALWWALAHRGIVRALAVLLAVAVPIAVLARYAVLDLLWVVLLTIGLWSLAILTGRAALRWDARPAGPAEHPVPPPSRPFLIMNPRSGDGKVGKFRLAEKARALGADVVVLDPAHPRDVADLARAALADGADLLGVAGGDGTQALVAGVAARSGTPFMVISAGTRNHFAMDLGLDREDPSTCLDALTDGVELHVDLGFVGGRVFVNNASFGAYAAVVQSPHYRADKVRTTMELLPELLTHHTGPRLTVTVTVTVGSVTIDAPQAVLVSNNPYQGGDLAGLGRRERLDTGELGVLGVTVDNAAQAAGLLRGRHGTGLLALTAAKVAVDADVPEIPVGVDGEALLLPTPVDCRIEPGALRVRVPRHRRPAPVSKPRLDWHRLVQLAFTWNGRRHKAVESGEVVQSGQVAQSGEAVESGEAAKKGRSDHG